MRTSELLSEREIMRCVVDSGPMSGQHLAMLERQKWARAISEHQATLKANPVLASESPEEHQRPQTAQVRLSHWLGAKFISVGHRLEGSPT